RTPASNGRDGARQALRAAVVDRRRPLGLRGCHGGGDGSPALFLGLLAAVVDALLTPLSEPLFASFGESLSEPFLASLFAPLAAPFLDAFADAVLVPLGLPGLVRLLACLRD